MSPSCTITAQEMSLVPLVAGMDMTFGWRGGRLRTSRKVKDRRKVWTVVYCRLLQ